MRTKGALAVVCVLVGTVATAQGALAAGPTQRGEAAAQARPGQPVQSHTVNRSSVVQNSARPAAVGTARAPSRPAPRQAAIAPQHQAQAALAAPVLARNALALGGTPLLPVSVTSGLSCVPFARMATGMAISGDAHRWWHNAADAYARGSTPERGAVMAFMATGGMTRGHVAVVSRVVNARTVEIDHANWGGPGVRRGTVMRGVTVVDVSDRNDWTAVRVQVGHSAEAFGRTYATHGFIYNRPESRRSWTAALSDPGELAESPSPHAALHLRLLAEALAE